MGAGSDSLIAALLHDALEDTSLTLGELTRLFGGDVSSLVDGVTKLNDPEIRAHPTLDEEIESLRKMIIIMQRDVRIMVIKLADRLHNMQTVSFLAPERQRGLAQETLDVYVKIADRLSMQDFHDELESLCIQILEPETYKKLTGLRQQNEQWGTDLIHRMHQELLSCESPLPKDCDVLFEPKTWDHIRMRLIAPDVTTGRRSSLTAAIVCSSIPQCYEILGILHQQWQYEILTFKDFINAPAANGYRGLHTTVILPDGTHVRCKIRTREMQAYARKGITALCFDGKAIGLLGYLPWAEHISPLSKDTAERSREFWQSLQSDIFGKSILIYGPNDTTMQLPKDSTALDGAFFLLQKGALNLESISINGAEVPLFTPLVHSVSLAVTTGRRPTFSREWLGWVHTGFATAMIRSALGEETVDKKVEKGKALLEQAAIQHSRGYLAEFKEEDLLRGLEPLGYISLTKAYIAIADGHLNPEVAVGAIFRPRRKNGGSVLPRVLSTVSFTVKEDAFPLIDRFLPIAKKYSIAIADIRATPLKQGRSRVRLCRPLSAEEQRSIVSELQAIGADEVSVTSVRMRVRTTLGIALIFFLWGFDPVFAHLLLTGFNVHALDLTIIRFLSLLGLSSVLLVWTTTTQPLRLTWLPLKSKSLWLSVVALFTVAFSTYVSLESTLPSHYTIPMTASGFMLTSLVNRRRWKTLLASWALLLAGVGLLIFRSQAFWPPIGMGFTFLAVAAFTLFSIVSERYKQRERVDVRAAQYFFILSVFCTVFILPFLPFAHLAGTYGERVIAAMILFSVIFTGLPYYLYYYILSHKEIDFVLRYSLLLIPITIIGQALIIGNTPWSAILLPAIIVSIGALLPLVSSWQHAQKT
jgi:(p)ppGpp synthase/HD superfamily hydrolase/drug/metabolite transporter (DMT)-like permease